MPHLQPLAKKIIEKWSRLVYNIRSEYDEHGEFHDEYRRMQHRLAKIRKDTNKENEGAKKPGSPAAEDESVDESIGGGGKDSIPKHIYAKVHIGHSGGIVLPSQGAFDFVERPEYQLE